MEPAAVSFYLLCDKNIPSRFASSWSMSWTANDSTNIVQHTVFTANLDSGQNLYM